MGKATNVIECGRCKKTFHAGCVNIQSWDVECLRCSGNSWLCPGCEGAKKAVSSVGEGSASPARVGVSGEPPSGGEDCKLDMILKQNQAILQEIVEVKRSIEFCLTSVAELSAKIEGLAGDVSALSGRVASAEGENLLLKKQLLTALDRIGRVEQTVLVSVNFVEIRGLPVKGAEDLPKLSMST